MNKICETCGHIIEEEWVDVTKECTAEIIQATCNKEGGFYINLFHDTVKVACIGLSGSYLPSGYRVETVDPKYITGMGTFKVFKKVTS